METLNNAGSKEAVFFPYLGKMPDVHPSVFIASGVKIIGDVKIGERSSVWYNTVIRGDVHYIRIGSETNIQDSSMLHVTHDTSPLNIGNKVTVGHSVKLHGCTVKDLSLIGIGAVVLDDAVIEENAFVAAGSVIKPGFKVPGGTLAAGVPAKIVRDLSKEEIEYFEVSAQHYIEYVKKTRESLKNGKIGYF